MASHDRARAHEALRINTRLLAGELAGLGIDVDCVPLLDLQFPGAHDVIGNRSFGGDPELVAALGRIVCDTMLADGVMGSEEHTSELQSQMRNTYAVTRLTELK